MKWSVAGLLLLGIGAAFSASLLVVSLKLTPQANANVPAVPTETQIVLAGRALSAMSIVDGSSVVVKTVPVADAPKNALRLPTDVIGKLLSVPVVEGQPFTTSCFADDTSGARLASALKDGMRAVSISLKPEKAGPLYPGCVVDVLVSLNRPSTEGSGAKEAMSMTLLQGVGVLAIDDLSVMSDEALAEPSKPETTSSTPMRDRKDRLVTLMVNSSQAKALQLAAQYGAVSLALRNPQDVGIVETDSTMLSDLADPYTRIVEALSATQIAAFVKQAPKGKGLGFLQVPAAVQAAADPLQAPPESAAVMASQTEAIESEQAQPPAVKKPEEPRLDFVVNRSGDVEVVRFRMHDLSFAGIKDGLIWIWEGRATSPKSTGK